MVVTTDNKTLCNPCAEVGDGVFIDPNERDELYHCDKCEVEIRT